MALKVIFRTNFDFCSRFTWPTLDHPPIIGDIIRANQKSLKGYFVELEVCRRTFYTATPDVYCECELKMPSGRFKDLSSFEKAMGK